MAVPPTSTFWIAMANHPVCFLPKAFIRRHTLVHCTPGWLASPGVFSGRSTFWHPQLQERQPQLCLSSWWYRTLRCSNNITDNNCSWHRWCDGVKQQFLWWCFVHILDLCVSINLLNYGLGFLFSFWFCINLLHCWEVWLRFVDSKSEDVLTNSTVWNSHSLIHNIHLAYHSTLRLMIVRTPSSNSIYFVDFPIRNHL